MLSAQPSENLLTDSVELSNVGSALELEMDFGDNGVFVVHLKRLMKHADLVRFGKEVLKATRSLLA